jgi:hypothetical protein
VFGGDDTGRFARVAVIFNSGVGIRETWIPDFVRVLGGALVTIVCDVITCLEMRAHVCRLVSNAYEPGGKDSQPGLYQSAKKSRQSLIIYQREVVLFCEDVPA